MAKKTATKRPNPADDTRRDMAALVARVNKLELACDLLETRATVSTRRLNELFVALTALQQAVPSGAVRRSRQ